MTFEHIVQINDLTKPELPVLTRFQVWEGLVLRARRPDKFLVGVDDYEILDQGPAYLKRSLQLPGLHVVDWYAMSPVSTAHGLANNSGTMTYQARLIRSACRPKKQGGTGYMPTPSLPNIAAARGGVSGVALKGNSRPI